MGTQLVNDAHRHLGKMPAFPFYGGPPCNPDMLARGSVAELIADLDSAGVERALVLPNYGVPDASVSFGFNPLVLEAAAADDRIRCGLWVSPRPQDAELNTAALALAGEQGSQDIDGGPHAVHEVVGRLRMELAGHVDLHDVAEEVHGGTDMAEHIDHREDVGDAGDVREQRPALGQQRGRH